jgi:transaldolase
VSFETDKMVVEGTNPANIHKNIVVKLPMIKEGLKATKILAGKGIRVNMTLVFSPAQALLAAKVGAAYVSPFVGRLDDISHDGMDFVR